ncbi:hypothetical protein GCM10018773_58180 [Streptomyces candidus]|nr:hypothetical protein GCM10018773_58180 [Streptomyces candidus]
MLSVSSDASFATTQKARAGIHVSRRGYPRKGVAVDLGPAGIQSSTQAEFLALCLAVMVRVDQRRPLIVQADEESSVRDLEALREGCLPRWLRRDGSDLAQRVAVTAMAALHLRTVSISHVPRRKVAQAHELAHIGNTDSRLNNSLYHPRTFARNQGIPLSWNDRDRGFSTTPAGPSASP